MKRIVIMMKMIPMIKRRNHKEPYLIMVWWEISSSLGVAASQAQEDHDDGHENEEKSGSHHVWSVQTDLDDMGLDFLCWKGLWYRRIQWNATFIGCCKGSDWVPAVPAHIYMRAMPQPQLRWLMSHKSDNFIAACHSILSNSSKAINSFVFQLFLIISMRQTMMNNSVTCPFPFFQVQFRIQPTKIRRSIWGHAAPLKVSSKDFSTVQLLPNGGRNQHSFMVLPMVSMVVPMGMVLLAILSVEEEGVGEGTSWGSSQAPDWGSSRTNGNGPSKISIWQSITCNVS